MKLIVLLFSKKCRKQVLNLQTYIDITIGRHKLLGIIGRQNTKYSSIFAALDYSLSTELPLFGKIYVIVKLTPLIWIEKVLVAPCWSMYVWHFTFCDSSSIISISNENSSAAKLYKYDSIGMWTIVDKNDWVLVAGTTAGLWLLRADPLEVSGEGAPGCHLSQPSWGRRVRPGHQFKSRILWGA